MLVSEAKGNLIARIIPPFLLIALCGPHLLLRAQEPKADVYQLLHYLYIGPQGNRVDSVAGVTNNGIPLRRDQSNQRSAGESGG
jgi:hypothetical protein